MATMLEAGVYETPPQLGTVIFHSANQLGPEPGTCPTGGHKQSDKGTEKAHRIPKDAVSDYWARQGQNDSTSAMQVVIPGATQVQEKGIDTSIVLYLFESMNAWDCAVLFSDDADFVPLVWSLRRRGKRVLCVTTKQQQASPLAIAAQHAIPLSTDYALADRAAYEIVLPNGPLDQYIAHLLDDKLANRPESGVPPVRPVIKIQGAGITITHRLGRSVDTAIFAPVIKGTPIRFETSDTAIGLRTDDRHGWDVFEGVRRHWNLVEKAAWLPYLVP
jgi:uncharacterized LabA/DUF88 family protein